MSASSDEEINRLATEIQLLEATLNVIKSRLDMTDATLSESQMALETLKALESAKEGDNILVPIGAGSYIFAKVESISKVVVGVGANVCVEKSIKESIDMISERISRLEQIKSSLQQQLVQASQKLEESRGNLERLIRIREAGGSARKS
ncbi:prefoldin subunit alpha [Candidatus Bathyarchaeota archaeon]|nr:prefoldin subunit alpha [Candidatus Bathyarchaeota archaeon]MBS7618774.1 prefoldin subunit alpha [Candidatus Bathyarchaeota archaeon]